MLGSLNAVDISTTHKTVFWLQGNYFLTNGISVVKRLRGFSIICILHMVNENVCSSTNNV